MKIALLGYGKMGQLIHRIAESRGHTVVLTISSANRGDLTPARLKEADVAIEFTTPHTASGLVRFCLEHGVPVVSGSTGWNEELERVKKECTASGGTLLHASNFSVGVNIFFAVNRLLARLMSGQGDYTPSLLEIHHTAKKDAPSGTAVTLAEGILREHPQFRNWVKGNTSEEGAIGIESERTDPAPGTHHVRWRSPIDDLEIIHTAHNREGFATGAVLAAEFLAGKKGVFTMEDVLGIS